MIPSSFPQGNLPGYTGPKRAGLDRVARGIRTEFFECPNCQSPTVLDTYISRRPGGDAIVTMLRCGICKKIDRTEEPFFDMPPIPTKTKQRLLRALNYPGQTQRTMAEEMGRGYSFINTCLHRGCSPEALADLEAHLDLLDAQYQAASATWEALEAGEALDHASLVQGVSPLDAAQQFADRLLRERIQSRVIEREIRVRAPGQRLWQKFSVKIVAVVEQKGVGVDDGR